jgi:hypothetical protein
VPAPRRIAALALCLAFALAPAAAHAQNGAGDEQYSDPFAGETTQPKPKPKPTQTQTQPSQQQAPQTTAQQPAAPAAAQAPAATSAPSALPRTGLDLIPVALVGLALVAAGLALRRRGAHGRD